MNAQLAGFKSLVYEHCGLLLEGIAEDRLRKVIYSNMVHTGCRSVADYRRLVCSDQAYLQELVGQLTVNETYFFESLSSLSC
ncbi:MAG: hypothetical protein RBQ83_06015 [Pseudomonas sp.]|nr:hypothetical protein [Pseudomonas sp.]